MLGPLGLSEPFSGLVGYILLGEAVLRGMTISCVVQRIASQRSNGESTGSAPNSSSLIYPQDGRPGLVCEGTWGKGFPLARHPHSGST